MPRKKLYLTDSEAQSPTSAVLYCRVSKDISGVFRSTGEQEDELRIVCDSYGLPVLEVVVDNDVGASRYSHGQRPGFQRLRELVRPDVALVSWESSRLTRRLVEFAELRDFCADLGMHWIVGGRMYNLTDPQDSYMLTLSIQNAELEVAMLRKRVLRTTKARAGKGRNHSRMPYGYRRVIDERTGKTAGWELDPGPAGIVRELVTKILAGHTTYNLIQDLNARKVPPPTRGADQPQHPWDARRLRDMVRTPTYAGLRVYRGEIVGKGDWEPIITEDEHRRLLAVLDYRAVKNTRVVGSKPVHLLTGIAVCDICEKGVRFHRSKSVERYMCPSNHVGRRVDKMDEMISAAMVSFLKDPRTIERLTAAEQSTGAADHFKREHDLRQQLDVELAEIINADLSPALRVKAMEAMQAKLTPQIEDAKRQARQAFRDPLLVDLVAAGIGVDAADMWEQLELDQQRAAIRAALTIRILRQPPSGRTWHGPKYVQVKWRE